MVLCLKFFVNWLVAILWNDTNLLSCFYLLVYTDNLRMRNFHGLLKIVVNALYSDRVLQGLLENLFETENQVCLCLLAQIHMRPFTHSQQFTHFYVFVLGKSFGFWTHRNIVDAELSRQMQLWHFFAIFSFYCGMGVIDGLLRFAQSRIIIKVSNLEVASLLGCLGNRWLYFAFLCIFVWWGQLRKNAFGALK